MTCPLLVHLPEPPIPHLSVWNCSAWRQEWRGTHNERSRIVSLIAFLHWTGHSCQYIQAINTLCSRPGSLGTFDSIAFLLPLWKIDIVGRLVAVHVIKFRNKCPQPQTPVSSPRQLRFSVLSVLLPARSISISKGRAHASELWDLGDFRAVVSRDFVHASVTCTQESRLSNARDGIKWARRDRTEHKDDYKPECMCPATGQPRLAQLMLAGQECQPSFSLFSLFGSPSVTNLNFRWYLPVSNVDCRGKLHLHSVCLELSVAHQCVPSALQCLLWMLSAISFSCVNLAHLGSVLFAGQMNAAPISVHLHRCAHLHLCACVCRKENNLSCPPQVLIFWDIVSHCPGTYQRYWQASGTLLSLPLQSWNYKWGLSYMTLFQIWILEIELRPSHV